MFLFSLDLGGLAVSPLLATLRRVDVVLYLGVVFSAETLPGKIRPFSFYSQDFSFLSSHVGWAISLFSFPPFLGFSIPQVRYRTDIADAHFSSFSCRPFFYIAFSGSVSLHFIF